MWLNLLCLVVLLISRSPAQIGRFVCTLVFENLKCFILTRQPVNQQLGHGSPRLIDACGEWRLASAVWSHRRITLAQITEKVKAGSDRCQNEQCITAYCVATNLCQCWPQSSTNNIYATTSTWTSELKHCCRPSATLQANSIYVSRMMNPVRLQTRFRNRNMTTRFSCWLGVSV